MKRRNIFTYITVSLCLLAACRTKPEVQRNIDAPYKHWLIYNLDVKTFQDSDGDGEGDFKGLTTRLQYLKELGVNTIWLAPFQPSPLKDDGYDITDYYAIDPKVGAEADLQAFLAAAKKLQLKVVMDIVLNHSSNEHPWFRSRRDWYLWSATRPKDWDKGMGFPGVENDTWHQDKENHQWYFHRFYNFQPDLNYQNPEVVTEAKKILAYWLDKGMDGFRLDAVPFIIDDPRQDPVKPKYDFALLQHLTRYVSQRKPDAVLLGEANVEIEENEQYFAGKHPGLQMMFNFYANQYLFLALATGDATKFKKALNDTKVKPGAAQWAWFLRNHDEVDLGRLSKDDLSTVYKTMGPDTTMQLYGRGIRRRLAPMLNNNVNKLRLAYSILYSLPGTPVIRQGEEIGMGDDLSLKERLAVRTPMQWDTTVYSGFTKGAPFRPVIDTGKYRYQIVNTVTEHGDKNSLLSYIEGLTKMRKQFPEMINGNWEVIDTPDEVLSILYTDKGKQVLASHNFSDKEQSFNVNGIKVKLPAYGHQWQKL